VPRQTRARPPRPGPSGDHRLRVQMRCSGVCLCNFGVVVDDLAVEDGHEHAGGRNLVRVDGEQVAVEDAQVGDLADLK